MDCRESCVLRCLTSLDLRELCRIVNNLSKALGNGFHIVVEFMDVGLALQLRDRSQH